MNKGRGTIRFDATGIRGIVARRDRRQNKVRQTSH